MNQLITFFGMSKFKKSKYLGEQDDLKFAFDACIFQS